MNLVIIKGRLTKDIELKGENTKVAHFNMAVNRKVAKDKEKQTDFISCIAFGKTAEFIQKNFKKGSEIAVTGRLQTGSYDDKDGKRVHTTDVVVDKVEFCGSKLANEQVSEQVKQDLTENSTEELPF